MRYLEILYKLSQWPLFGSVFKCLIPLSVDVVNQPTTKVGGGSSTTSLVVYSVNLIHTLGATDDMFSQAINLDNLIIKSISFKGFGVTNRDVNLFLQGAIGLLDADFVDSPYPRLLALNGDLDDFSPDAGNLTVVIDPSVYHINTAATGLEAAAAVVALRTVPDPAVLGRYFRLRSNGQSGNPVTSDTTCLILCEKIDLTHGRTSYAAVDTQ